MNQILTIMKIILLFPALVVVFIGCQQRQSSNEDSSTNDTKPQAPSIVGVWEQVETLFTNEDTSFVSNYYRSLFIFTEQYFSRHIAFGEIPSWPVLNEEEKISYDVLESTWNNSVLHAGTYEIRGDSIVHEILVAKSPNMMNESGRYSWAFTLNGDELITTGVLPSGNTIKVTSRRLE